MRTLFRVKDEETHGRGVFKRFDVCFNTGFHRLLAWYEGLAKRAMQRPGLTAAGILGGVALTLAVLFPFLGRAYFPRTDPGQFVINVRMPSGTRLEVSNDYIARVEQIIRSVVKPADLGMIVSNIGVYPDLSSIFTTNASMDTAFVQTSLKEDHSVGSYEYMQRVREKLSRQMPELTTYFQAGGLVDGVINQGLPAPIDVQIGSNDMDGAYALAKKLAQKIKGHAERQRRLHPAESRLSRHPTEHRPREGQLDRSLRARRRGQRHHRHDLRVAGRAQLLDRSQERQQLHGDRPVRQPCDQTTCRWRTSRTSPCAARTRPDTARSRRAAAPTNFVRRLEGRSLRRLSRP